MSTHTSPLTVAVIGAGPRGLGILERIVALAPRYDGDIHVDLVDPYPPGAGIVWRTDQPAELLMNTTIAEQTVFPDASCGVSPHSLGPDMGEWYRRTHDNSVPVDAVFGSRALYGEYLRWSYERLRALAPENVTVVHHATRATGLLEPTGTDWERQYVRLEDGRTLAARAVVLCLGHIPARLSDERADWAQYAGSAGPERLTYVPPGLPAEADLTALAPGEPVIFRGFGLGYFDQQTLLTVGRGGRFVEQDGRLRYVPSGREPILVPSSRRGVPYRSKPIGPDHPMRPSPLTHFTRAALPDRVLRFDGDVWPLVLSDLEDAWRAAGGAPADFDLHALLRPLEGRTFTCRGGDERGAARTPAHARDAGTGAAGGRDGVMDAGRGASGAELPEDSLHAWMLDWIRGDLADSLAGPERAPVKALFAVLWEARLLVKELVAEARIDEASYVSEVRGWFEDFVSGICDGPPPQRFAELLALAEAGIVRFVGPDVRITTGRAGEPALFRATSPAVPDEVVEARTLVDASSPANRVTRADDVLLAGMLESGQVVPARVDVDGVEQVSSGLLVEGPAMHTVDSRGRAHPHRYVHSIQLSAVRMGLAIAANPGRGARMLRDAHALVEDLLGLGSDDGSGDGIGGDGIGGDAS